MWARLITALKRSACVAFGWGSLTNICWEFNAFLYQTHETKWSDYGHNVLWYTKRRKNTLVSLIYCIFHIYTYSVKWFWFIYMYFCGIIAAFLTSKFEYDLELTIMLGPCNPLVDWHSHTQTYTHTRESMQNACVHSRVFVSSKNPYHLDCR